MTFMRKNRMLGAVAREEYEVLRFAEQNALSCMLPDALGRNLTGTTVSNQSEERKGSFIVPAIKGRRSTETTCAAPAWPSA